MTAAGRIHLSICVVGHVDSGKSTTTGHLLFKLGGITEREKEKACKAADEQGKGSFGFAYVMDLHKDERARGVTISCTAKKFMTSKYECTIIDAPGHRDFIKNMISGSSQADAAIIMMPCDGNFVVSIQKGNHKQGIVEGQTRQHTKILCNTGIKQVICCINKMDSQNYSQERFNECRAEFQNTLIKCGYKRDFVEKSVPFIPISGLLGENMLEISDKMPWWKGVDVIDIHGVTKKVTCLLDALNDFISPPIRNIEAPMRMPVSGVFKLRGVGDVITGRIEEGVVEPNKEVVFLPSHSSSTDCSGKVFTVEMHHEKLERGMPGDNVGINIKGLNKDNMPRVGDVMVYKDDKTISAVKTFTMTCQLLEIPNEIKPGYTPIMFVRCARAPCRLDKIVWKMGKETGGKKVENPTSVKSNEVFLGEWSCLGPMCCSTFAKCNQLGRMSGMDGGSFIMFGRIETIEYRA